MGAFMFMINWFTPFSGVDRLTRLWQAKLSKLKER